MDDTLQLNDSNLDKNLINSRSILGENLEKSSRFRLSFCPDIIIVTESNNQDQTLTTELSHFNIDESNLLRSTVIAADNKTIIIILYNKD